jgi:hypothetical protein
MNYKNPVCRGCWAFGNNCGSCERCIETKPVVTPAVTNDADKVHERAHTCPGYVSCHTCKEQHISRLQAQLAEAQAALKARDDALTQAVELINFSQRQLSGFTTNSSLIFGPLKELWNKNAGFLSQQFELQNKYIAALATQASGDKVEE